MEGTGRKARVWGSFTQAAQGEDINAEGVEINLWNFGYANMDEMYDDGFDLINCNDGNYYIVPNAGYYYDYLPDSTMYNLAINTISGVTIPAGDPQMKGGAFAVWNDMTDYLYNGVSEYDIWDRISNLPLFAAKLWGRGDMDLTQAQAASDALGEAPRTNFGYEVDSATDEYINMPMDTLDDTSENDFAVNEGENASIVEVDGKNALQLNGGTSYITTGLETAGLGNDLRVKVKRTSDSTDDQILFESPYGSIKAVQGDTGKVGFTRELYDYSFNYTLPVNEWVELEFKNQQNVIELYVNGSLVDTLGDDEQIQGRPMRATCMFPMAKVGSETDAFVGYVDDVRLGVNDDFASTMALDYAVETANAVMDAESSDVLQPLIDQAKELFTQYAPDAAAIESLTAQINDVLAGMDYEKADYSRVNAYLDLIDDLSVFTDATVKTLEMAVEAVRENLPASMQATVLPRQPHPLSCSGLRVQKGQCIPFQDNKNDFWNNVFAVQKTCIGPFGDTLFPRKHAPEGPSGTCRTCPLKPWGPGVAPFPQDSCAQSAGHFALICTQGTRSLRISPEIRGILAPDAGQKPA